MYQHANAAYSDTESKAVEVRIVDRAVFWSRAAMCRKKTTTKKTSF